MSTNEQHKKRLKVDKSTSNDHVREEDERSLEWSGLPVDMQREILSFIELEDALSLRMTSRDCRSLADWELEARVAAQKSSIRPRHMQDSVFGTDFFQVIEFEAGWNEIFTEENNVSAEILEFFLELSRDGIEIDLCTMDDPIAYINNIERFEEVGITEEGDDVTHRFERDYHVHIDKKRAMAKVHWLLSDYSKSIENVRFSSNPRLSRQVLELCFGIIMHATDLRFVGYRCKQLKDEGGSTRCTVRSKFALLMTASTGKQYQLSLTENVICQYDIID